MLNYTLDEKIEILEQEVETLSDRITRSIEHYNAKEMQFTKRFIKRKKLELEKAECYLEKLKTLSAKSVK
jgi:hypothetical protein